MCQYSAHGGYITSWHKTHLGSFATRGASLVLTEVHAVSPEGRISPEDAGIWEDGQVAPLREVVQFVHSQGAKIGIQIGHAGRKASTLAPWLDRKAVATEEVNGAPFPFRPRPCLSMSASGDEEMRQYADSHVRDQAGGWPTEVISSSELPFSEDTYVPRAMTIADIEDLKTKWVAAVKRALDAGFDVRFRSSPARIPLCATRQRSAMA
jgi:2,4-dienoyl-CoA reductase-like NADH-dependent reductase (Old Yellow Enzyme family)